METKVFVGEVVRIGIDQVRLILDDGNVAFLPRGVIPENAGRKLKIGARVSVKIKRAFPDATEEWEIRILPDKPGARYALGRGERNGMKDTMVPGPKGNGGNGGKKK